MAAPAMPKARQLQRARREEQAASPLDAAFKLVDSLAVPVFFKSRDGRYLGVNRAWEEFFGIRGEAFIGKQVADLYPQDPAIAERHAAMDRSLYAHPGRQDYEIKVRAANGELRDTIYYKATYTDARGELAGLIGAIVDITARTRAEAALTHGFRSTPGSCAITKRPTGTAWCRASPTSRHRGTPRPRCAKARSATAARSSWRGPGSRRWDWTGASCA